MPSDCLSVSEFDLDLAPPGKRKNQSENPAAHAVVDAGTVKAAACSTLLSDLSRDRIHEA